MTAPSVDIKDEAIHSMTTRVKPRNKTGVVCNEQMMLSDSAAEARVVKRMRALDPAVRSFQIFITLLMDGQPPYAKTELLFLLAAVGRNIKNAFSMRTTARAPPRRQWKEQIDVAGGHRADKAFFYGHSLSFRVFRLSFIVCSPRKQKEARTASALRL
ncbi:hypothetical protein EVAR_86125_1 [Eumeta japonica]|uniref:Uncharacterized protein n=1 Tax=Eumeta variegata TaxID=151549 RepID=A0A4C1V0L3_EUMVA|nr:hypothetical protein EVAR_86125_1 [Eumeta japonica]